MRVLHVIGAMDCAGTETFLMNLYHNIDRNKVQFDFVVHTEKQMFYEKEIFLLGGKIFRVPQFKGYNILSLKLSVFVLKYLEFSFLQFPDISFSVFNLDIDFLLIFILNN